CTYGSNYGFDHW
nr:immunoglobulin heavy chain junction region [Macaca mulatta]